MNNITINDREHATVLAALRCYQQRLYGSTWHADFYDMASNGGKHRPMNRKEIDGLCERLNCTDTVFPANQTLIEQVECSIIDLRRGAKSDMLDPARVCADVAWALRKTLKAEKAGSSDLVPALKALVRDVNKIKGHWTEGLDNSMQRALAALKAAKKGV